jgi:glycosyltransferase involved in cell wall biosynthesis
MRRKLLIISHVWPFPGSSGQQLRVRHTVEAAVREFDVDFLTYAPSTRRKEVAGQLAAFGCRPVVLASCSPRSGPKRLAHLVASRMFVLLTGAKSSNYLIGEVELSVSKIRSAIVPEDYCAVIYEYFHAVNSVPMFQNAGVPAILDMHNVLWKSKEQRLSECKAWPAWFKQMALRRYRQQEESAWDRFDALVAINRSECNLVQVRQQRNQKLFYAPMGTDLSRWPPCWRPANPPRVAYYGGLGSPHNEAAALRCHEHVMPRIWQKFPKSELWLVGSNPPDRLRRLASDTRIKVTGFVEQVQAVLSTMSLVLCPWSGNYGFRSRIVEVMALGVPVVATPAAVDGMELQAGRGIILADTNDALADEASKLLADPEQLGIQSRLARAEMERLYSLENTYGRLIRELGQWLDERKDHRPACPPVPESTVPSPPVGISAS